MLIDTCLIRARGLALAALLLVGVAPVQAGEPAPVSLPPTVQAEELPYQVLDMDWQDDARQRAVPVRLYLPRQASAEQPVPLVLFSHGMGGSRRGYSYLGRYWASQGYASLHVQHVGSDREIWFGNTFTLLSRLHDAANESEALARVADVRFALDSVLADGELGPLINPQHIVAAGHSYGANTSLLLAGAQVQRGGKPLNLRDSRIKAAILLSAPPFHGEKDAAGIVGGIEIPTLHITNTEDVIRIPGYYSDAEDRVALFDATGGGQKLLAVFEGGSHNIFTDRKEAGGIFLNPKIKEATQALSLAFLRRLINGDASQLQSWPERFAPLLARFVPDKS